MAVRVEPVQRPTVRQAGGCPLPDSKAPSGAGGAGAVGQVQSGEGRCGRSRYRGPAPPQLDRHELRVRQLDCGAPRLGSDAGRKLAVVEDLRKARGECRGRRQWLNATEAYRCLR